MVASIDRLDSIVDCKNGKCRMIAEVYVLCLRVVEEMIELGLLACPVVAQKVFHSVLLPSTAQFKAKPVMETNYQISD